VWYGDSVALSVKVGRLVQMLITGLRMLAGNKAVNWGVHGGLIPASFQPGCLPFPVGSVGIRSPLVPSSIKMGRRLAD